MVSAKTISDQRVVSTVTTSLREILSMFSNGEDYQLLRLKADASNLEKKKPYIDDKNYGVVGFLDRGSDTFDLDYKLEWDDNGNPKNPIDAVGRKQIERHMNTLGIEDAPVNYMELLINDPEIGNRANVNEKIFQAFLYSEKPNGDQDMNAIKDFPINEDLIKNCGFQYRLLNCRKLIDRKQILTKKTTDQKWIIRWEGETAVSLNSPIKVAQRLKKHFEPYQLLKRFEPDQDDILRLVGVSR